MTKPAVPLLDLPKQYAPLRDALVEVFANAVDTGQFIMGATVREFEYEMAQVVGAPHAIACASGTDALLLAMMALNVGPGDAVITTPYSFFSTASCITRVGARPLFVDIEPETFNMSADAVRHLIEEDCDAADGGLIHRATGARVKALLPVHLFGQCADMDTLRAIATEHGLPVVEDAAQALGAKWGGHNAGMLGDISCFSFYPSKNLGGLGDGGILTTSSDEHADMLRRLRLHGAQPKYIHRYVGINSRLDTIQAGCLRVLLPHLPEWEAARRTHAAAYDEAFAGMPGIVAPAQRERAHHVFNQYVIRLRDRKATRDYLTSKGIGTEVYYPVSLHQQECFADLGYATGDFPESERAADESLAIPVGPTLTDDQQRLVVNTLLEVVQ